MTGFDDMTDAEINAWFDGAFEDHETALDARFDAEVEVI